jgi:translocating chain-associated membrane protein 1
MGFKRGKSGNKNVPYLSHEFVIQNHGDIVTCIMMVFTVGLMFQITTPLASVFIIPAHVIEDSQLLNYGAQDIALVLFYTLAAVVFHAVIQEYILDVILLVFFF